MENEKQRKEHRKRRDGDKRKGETGKKNKASTQWWGKLEKENYSLVTPRILEEPCFVANPVTLPVSSKAREWPPRAAVPAALVRALEHASDQRGPR